MPQMQFTIADFTQTSTWTASWYEGEGETYLVYSTPSTDTDTKAYDISTLPSGAIIDSALLAQARNDPWTGISLRQIDGVAWTGSRDVTAQMQALGGVYTTLSFAFKFKANGGAGGAGTRTSTLSLTANTLTVNYHMPTSTGTLDKATVNAGEDIKVTITPAESGRTHKVVWTFGTYTDNSGTLDDETLEDTLAVPMSWLNNIPNAISGVANCRLETYDGATLLGYADYPFSIACPGSVVPSLTFPAPTHIPYSEGVSEWGYVQGYSKASMAITEAEGAYGSTIVSRNIIGGGYDSGTEDELTTGLINAVGTVTFTARVTDSRGRTKTETQSVNVNPYQRPWLVSNVEERCLSTGVFDNFGTYAKVYIDYAISAIGDNSATATVKWREVGGAWGAEEVISDATALTVGDNDFDVEKAYEVQYTVTDALATRTFDGYVTKAQFLMELAKSGKAIGFGTAYGEDETFTFNPAWEAIGLKIFPVGSIYMSVSDANPSTYFGGTWEAWGSGRVPVGVDAAQSEFNTVEKTGGAKTHTLTVDEMPSHAHGTNRAGYTTTGANGDAFQFANLRDESYDPGLTNTGGGQAHNNLQPYIACYMWKRTA